MVVFAASMSSRNAEPCSLWMRSEMADWCSSPLVGMRGPALQLVGPHGPVPLTTAGHGVCGESNTWCNGRVLGRKGCEGNFY